MLLFVFPVDDIRIFISFKGKDPCLKPRFHFEIQRQFRQGYIGYQCWNTDS
jgi:hypothetical protein